MTHFLFKYSDEDRKNSQLSKFSEYVALKDFCCKNCSIIYYQSPRIKLEAQLLNRNGVFGKIGNKQNQLE